MKKKENFKAAVLAGVGAGIISGLVKMGWENILPPRTAERDKTNPPQQFLQQLGVPAKLTHATYTYSGHKLPWVSYILHYGFSTTFAIIYEVLGQNQKWIKAGDGTIYGLAVWVLYHIFLLPNFGTIPAVKDQPIEEHISEAIGHMAWMWTNDVVGDELYYRLTHRDK